jgi:hypothetical protein
MENGITKTENVRAEIRGFASLEPQSMADARMLAKVAVDSKFFAVKSEAEALVILMTGRDLGLSSMQALRGISVVQGRPVLGADLMVAVVLASDKCEYWQSIESTPEKCTIETKRRGSRGPVRKTWTVEDARRAGLGGKGPWQQYPSQMLRHRCAADLARECYPDLLLGIYSPDEIDPGIAPASVHVEVAAPAASPVARFDADAWQLRIANADFDGLVAIRDSLKSLTPEQRDELRAPWWMRRIALCPLEDLVALRATISKMPSGVLREDCQRAWQARSDALHTDTAVPDDPESYAIRNEGV